MNKVNKNRNKYLTNDGNQFKVLSTAITVLVIRCENSPLCKTEGLPTVLSYKGISNLFPEVCPGLLQFMPLPFNILCRIWVTRGQLGSFNIQFTNLTGTTTV